MSEEEKNKNKGVRYREYCLFPELSYSNIFTSNQNTTPAIIIATISRNKLVKEHMVHVSQPRRAPTAANSVVMPVNPNNRDIV